MSQWQRSHGYADDDDPDVRARRYRQKIKRWQTQLEAYERGTQHSFNVQHCEKWIAYWTAKLMSN